MTDFIFVRSKVKYREGVGVNVFMSVFRNYWSEKIKSIERNKNKRINRKKQKQTRTGVKFCKKYNHERFAYHHQILIFGGTMRTNIKQQITCHYMFYHSIINSRYKNEQYNINELNKYVLQNVRLKWCVENQAVFFLIKA